MKRMHSQLLIMLMTLSLMPLVMMKIRRFARLKADPLSRTRCDLVCFDVQKESKPTCRSQCKEQELKPGTCPTQDSPKWAEACVEACNTDSQCDGTQRCCHLGCGSTCSDPVDLLTLPGLPALPTMGEPKERKRSIVVKWSDGVGDAARATTERILFLLEEQHHLGPKYEEARLGDWTLLMRTNKTKVSLRDTLKPGRWYRFRVAAVSAAGTRGYSAPSSPFTPRKGPRPPPQPKKLKVKPLKSNNGTISIRLQWKEPRSDLPVLRYKVFWSRRVRGLQSELDSVIVNHQTVPKDQTHYDITDLQPNSMYFLQVQTISQYGLGKLRSDKAAIFYNTTSIRDNAPEPLKQQRIKKIKGLRLNKIIWVDNKIKAKISWESLSRNNEQTRRYYVHWQTHGCENKAEKPKDLFATTEETSFEIYELHYSCKYKVHVNKSPPSKSKVNPDSELIVSIPDCKSFQRRMTSNNGSNFNCLT